VLLSNINNLDFTPISPIAQGPRVFRTGAGNALQSPNRKSKFQNLDEAARSLRHPELLLSAWFLLAAFMGILGHH
jgi:hypothetical protein